MRKVSVYAHVERHLLLHATFDVRVDGVRVMPLILVRALTVGMARRMAVPVILGTLEKRRDDDGHEHSARCLRNQELARRYWERHGWDETEVGACDDTE
ncbi:hypothetical protein EP30_05345 [Bifidobacterium sp. UTCIF-39]|uniref:hypothetical protein n=1 Tax=Bifidobacterium sp. UTCIF-39 TaxID=1465359 RepID=UPI00112A589F|nr:hypothetical protein [Bifidobacterium sp. UTCIF-39]TPF96843.1 hypothetical protein EP30_05345 [Bifidobacterium sp. UTCIF-39]